MAHVKKGHTVASPQWWKHLRGWKRVFWKKQRKADLKAMREDTEMWTILWQYTDPIKAAKWGGCWMKYWVLSSDYYSLPEGEAKNQLQLAEQEHPYCRFMLVPTDAVETTLILLNK